MRIFLEKVWLWKLLATLTVDLGFCTEQIDFCCNLFVDYFATLFVDYFEATSLCLLSTIFQSKNRLKQAYKYLKKCIRFCLNVNSKAHIGLTEFEIINWLPINDRFEQCISSMTFKYFNNLNALYMNDVFKPAGQNITTTRTSFRKQLQKINYGQKSISYVAPRIWNKFPD